MIRLMVSYYDCGLNHLLDATLEKAAGRLSVGSGFDFMAKRRDIDWEFKQMPAAKKAEKRLKAVLKKLKVKNQLSISAKKDMDVYLATGVSVKVSPDMTFEQIREAAREKFAQIIEADRFDIEYEE